MTALSNCCHHPRPARRTSPLCGAVRIGVVMAALLLLAACAPRYAKRAPTPPLAVHCDARCMAGCDAPWPRWQGNPNDPKTWDRLGEVVAALRDRVEHCDLSRVACVQCLQRLERAGVICGLTETCSEVAR